MAQNVIQLFALDVDDLGIQQRGEAAAGKGIDKVVTEQVAAIVQDAAQGKGQCHLTLFGTLTHLVDGVTEVDNPLAGLDRFILALFSVVIF